MSAVGLPSVLGGAWALLTVGACIEIAAARRGRARATGLAPVADRRAPTRDTSARIRRAVWTRATASRRQRRTADRRRAVIETELPVAIDLLGVAVGAGYTPYLAVEIASRWAPPTLGELLTGVVGACRLGSDFDVVLDELARTHPGLRGLADALLATERLGAPVQDALERLAVVARAGLRRRAEAHARTVPVRLLFPLVFLVLPAFALLTVVPAVGSRLAG